MSQYIIEGGHTISGEIEIDGAKNSVLPILAATVITGGITVLTNCPDLTDVKNTLLILESLGCKTEFINDRITVDSSNITSTTILPELAGSLRSSITFLGALLARRGEVTTAHPGGCAVVRMHELKLHVQYAVLLKYIFEFCIC
ncbi:MAG: UDP-N-acetylglucosamine 1-carboxyvinyltransferase [Ruminococcaceae bacterium]|nr:UDP-N-acetylglucosamine 1-carboxyvinyltransferase [Oscillospiraceae bacterium]